MPPPPVPPGEARRADPTTEVFGSPSRPPSFSFLDPPQAEGEIGRLAQYRVRRVLGSGGMGFVFEGEDVDLRRPVALKVMRPELAADDAFRSRFLTEARAAAALSSDYVVTVYQVGSHGGLPFQAMQLLYGESLQDRLGRSAPLPVGLAVVIGRQVAEGLADAHAVGLVHRDIKPANLWLEADRLGGAFKRARILDFGLARDFATDARLTATGVIVGTPHYMAPEQANGHPVDGRADVFSLGCVMFAMLTGEMAFDGPTTMAVLMALANHTPPSVTALNMSVPPDLDELVGRMLAKDPAARPASARLVMEQLDAIAGGMSSVGAYLLAAGGEPPAVPVAAGTPIPSAAQGVLSDYARTYGGSTVAFDSGAAPPAAPPAARVSRRELLVGTAVGAVAVGGVLTAVLGRRPAAPAAPAAVGDPVAVGVLHSTTGTMADSEGPVVDAVMLAVDELNQAGGVVGRPVRAVVVDGRSDPRAFAEAAERLLTADRVAAVFGCWTSASRKAVRTIIERHNGVLFYPVQYEGLEDSPRVVYLGPTANQQLLPAVDFLVGRGLTRLFLVGSDYVFPRAAHEVVKDALKGRSGAAVVGERFLPLGERSPAAMRAVAAAVAAAAPHAVLNTVNGSTNLSLLPALEAAGPPVADVPVLSVSLTEADLRLLPPEAVAGHYLAGTYFESMGRPAGRQFLAKVRARYGADRRASDPMAAAYAGVHLWAEAAAAAGTTDPTAVLAAIRGRSFAGPDGPVRIDPETRHAWLPIRIGRVEAAADGGVTVAEVLGRPEPIRPVPYPPTRTRAEWDRFLTDLRDRWGGRWQAEAADR